MKDNLYNSQCNGQQIKKKMFNFTSIERSEFKAIKSHFAPTPSSKLLTTSDNALCCQDCK